MNLKGSSHLVRVETQNTNSCCRPISVDRLGRNSDRQRPQLVRAPDRNRAFIWCLGSAIAVTSSELAQCHRYRHVATLGSVLVPQRGAGCGVPEPAHQLGQCGARRRGQDGSGVAEVMEPQIRPSSGLTGPVERLVERRGGQVRAPSAAGNSSPSLPPVMLFRRWSFIIGIRCGGIATSRVPASDFGVPTMNCPPTWTRRGGRG